MGNVWSQAIWLPKPTLTEKNTPDQSNRVHVVTGGYTGCGLDLAKILYAHNAHVYIAGRSPQKYADAEKEIVASAPNSKGSCSFVKVDFADLTSVKPAAEDLLKRADRIDVLTQNAGVMMPPITEKTVQGEDLQLGTNCLGSWLFYALLRPRLVETAKRNDVKPGETRVTWAGSMAIEILSPKPGGVVLIPDASGGQRPKVLNNIRSNYGQSKVGNLYMAVEGAKRDAKDGIVHVAWNPGNLKTPLYRHGSAIQNAFTVSTHSYLFSQLACLNLG